MKPSTSKTAGGMGAALLMLVMGFVAHHEGYVPRSYADPIGVPTICYGHTGPDVTPGRMATREECAELLRADILVAHATVVRCIDGPMTNGQTAALVSATFNTGPKIVCGSTLQRLANAGDWRGACAQLDRWVYAGGRVLPGLVKRRAAERALCEKWP